MVAGSGCCRIFSQLEYYSVPMNVRCGLRRFQLRPGGKGSLNIRGGY